MTAPAAVSMRVEPEERALLFSRLLVHYAVEPDHRGWVHVKCPSCGKDSSRNNIHFSFSQDHGAKCQACGYGANLKQLCARLGLLDTPIEPLPMLAYHAPAVKHYRWMDELPDYLKRYEAHKLRFSLWNDYRDLTREQVERYRLGVGRFPEYSSQCQHDRLMMPLLQNGVPVAFRGRSIDADCHHAKWLTTATGGRPPLLFNGGVLLREYDRSLVNHYDLCDSLGPYCRNRVLMIVENPVDCLLLESAGICAVATLGVTMFTQERPWLALLRQAQPSRVVVMYDHDLPGNGASSEAEYQSMVQAWKQAHANIDPPISNGLRLANMINGAGIPAQAFRWPESAPIKADPGWLIEKVGASKIHDICHL